MLGSLSNAGSLADNRDRVSDAVANLWLFKRYMLSYAMKTAVHRRSLKGGGHIYKCK